MSDREFESRLKMLLRMQEDLTHIQIIVWVMMILCSTSLGCLGYLLVRGL